jgi:K+-sensing histidine kinase KdpD
LSAEMRAELKNTNVTSLMLFPMKNSTSWYGVLALHFKENRVWTHEDRRHIEGLVDQVLIAIDNVLLLASEAKARTEAEKANQLKLQFLAMISHELRTPLTSIKGFSTTLLAEDTTWEAEMQQEFLSIIDEETDKLTGLIDQLLDLSRLQAGTLSISPVYENFSSVLDSAMIHLQLITREHHLYVQTPPKLPILSVDTERIAQVIENLVENAVKYSAPDTRITLTVNIIADCVQVDVTDEGIGIPTAEREHIFDAFHQVKRNKSARGAGLGLAICKGLIEAHGGKIWVQKTSEKGTTISFSLPIPIIQ